MFSTPQNPYHRIPAPSFPPSQSCSDILIGHTDPVWSGLNTAGKPPRLRELSVGTEISRYKTCPSITEGTTSYAFFSTNEQRGIRHHITCSSSNLVYMIQCNKCNVQYIGEMKRHLSDRFGEHRRAIEKVIANPPGGRGWGGLRWLFR